MPAHAITRSFPSTAVLRIAPDDPDALAAKLFLLVDTARTKDALDLLATSAGHRSRFPFEYAYCLYKEGRIEDALRQLDNVPAQRALDRKARAAARRQPDRREKAGMILTGFARLVLTCKAVRQQERSRSRSAGSYGASRAATGTPLPGPTSRN